MFSIIKNTFQRTKLPTAGSLYPPPTSYRLGTVARREAILVLPRAAQGGSAGSVHRCMMDSSTAACHRDQTIPLVDTQPTPALSLARPRLRRK